jgi:alkylation response protein AidB-like acyl-CoA dehydrogenase
VDFGGQGLPKTIGAACGEMLNSANMSFALCPLLTDGAIEALLDRRQRRTQGHLPGKADRAALDRHHEPDRAAGRL